MGGSVLKGPVTERLLRSAPGSPRYIDLDLLVSPQARLAILVAMSLAEHVPLGQVKNRLSEVVDRLEREHGRVVITRHGRPAAVIISIEDLESLEETLAVLSEPRLLDAVREAEDDLVAGRTQTLTKEQASALIAGS